MREHNRWTLAKQALEAVLKMTTEGDYVTRLTDYSHSGVLGMLPNRRRLRTVIKR